MTIPASRMNLTDTRAIRRAGMEWTNGNYGFDCETVTAARAPLFKRRPVACAFIGGLIIAACVEVGTLAINVLL